MVPSSSSSKPLFSGWNEIKSRADRYGTEINSYDWLKFIALVIMTVDHIGSYLLPDDGLWLRAIGRLCVPIWFFLCGYSKSQKLGGEILWLGLALTPLNYLSGHGIFPLNVLFSMIFCRYALEWMEARNTKIFDAFIVCLMLTLPTSLFFEYGTAGLALAIIGRKVREGAQNNDLAVFTLLTLILFLGLQFLWFDFSAPQAALVIIGSTLILLHLYRFQMQTSPLPVAENTSFLIRLIARNTLHYYFYHRSLLQLIGLLAGISYFRPDLIFN